ETAGELPFHRADKSTCQVRRQLGLLVRGTIDRVVAFSSPERHGPLSGRESRRVDTLPNNPCSIKSELLRKYIGKMDALYDSVRNNAEVGDEGQERIQVTSANRRVVESREDSIAARAQYIGHVHDHGC